MTAAGGDRRVVVVTGGGSGIGAAVATELGRRGDHVVTVDPLVSVDGTQQLDAPGPTTAASIVDAGGSAVASDVSVTDRDAVAALVADLLRTHGRLDAVVNVAGITRPTGFATGTEDDWAAVLAVHLDGYRNLLDAALPAMAEAGRGHVLGVTSGSGWRAADAGAYSCAKRAVASLTWQVGRAAPPGVSVNAISPIAMTRMVTAALERARDRAATGGGAAPPRRGGGGGATGGLALGSLPEPEHLGPLAASLTGHGTGRLRGRVLFAGGSEVSVVEPPRLLEVVRTGDVASVDAVLGAVTAGLVAAEAAQATTGGANPRFGRAFDAPDPSGAAAPGPPAVGTAAVVGEDGALAAALAARLEGAGVRTLVVPTAGTSTPFDTARAVLADARSRLGGLDAVVIASSPSTPARDAGGTGGWRGVLDSHDGLSARLLGDAAWARAVADLSGAGGHAVRLVSVVDARDAGGRSRAQVAAQLARASGSATDGRVQAFAVGVEAPGQEAVVASLAGRLLTAEDAVGLAGAELAVGDGWAGLRNHPRPTGSVVFGGPGLPPWFDDVLDELAP